MRTPEHSSVSSHSWNVLTTSYTLPIEGCTSSSASYAMLQHSKRLGIRLPNFYPVVVAPSPPHDDFFDVHKFFLLCTSADLAGAALCGIVFSEPLDFQRHYGTGAFRALLAAIGEDKVCLLLPLATFR